MLGSFDCRELHEDFQTHTNFIRNFLMIHNRNSCKFQFLLYALISSFYYVFLASKQITVPATLSDSFDASL